MTCRAAARAASAALALALAGCAATPADTCRLQRPPDASRLRTTHGVSLATFPGQVPAGYTGCQRTWIGDVRDLDGMQLLATTHFAAGRAIRFEGQPVDGAAYDCRYVDGRLHPATSTNPDACPRMAAELER